MDCIFGLKIIDEAKQLLKEKEEINIKSISNLEIEELIRKRKQAKMEKDYDEADKIREILKESGIFLIDTPTGTIWEMMKD